MGDVTRAVHVPRKAFLVAGRAVVPPGSLCYFQIPCLA